MSLVTLSYEIDTGIRRASDEVARIAAIDVTRGELDLLGFTVINDVAEVSAATQVTRTITLETTTMGSSSFPTNANLAEATRRLYKAALEHAVPSVVVSAEPFTEASVPSDIPNLVFWWRADVGVTFNATTKLVSNWQDIETDSDLDGTAPAQPLHILESADFNNQQSMSYDGGDTLISATLASVWRFLHDGTGMTLVIVGRPESAAAVQAFVNTATGAAASTGLNLEYDGPGLQWTWTLSNGAALIVNVSQVGSAINTNYWIMMRYEEGRAGNEWAFDVATAAAIQTQTGNSAGGPALGDPANTLRLGTIAGALEPILASGELPEVIVYNRYITDAQRATISSYMDRRYAF